MSKHRPTDAVSSGEGKEKVRAFVLQAVEALRCLRLRSVSKDDKQAAEAGDAFANSIPLSEELAVADTREFFEPLFVSSCKQKVTPS